MANAPSPGDIESLARQYWDTWSGLFGMGPPADPWAAMGGLPPAGMAEPAGFDWYARMQQLAAQFADGGGTADIGAAWRSMLGGQDGSAFAGVLHGMPGGLGALGAGWPEQVRPFVEALLRPVRQQAAEWLGRPGLGPGREHQQRLQALAVAWQEWEERNEAFTALLSRIGQDAFVRFERLLQQHESPEKRLATVRALFDLWIDAAEEAWAEAALSEDYQQHYAALANALMRVRQGLQDEVERMGTLLGLPGRTELDAVHRKVTELERSVHALRRVAGLGQGTTPAHAAGPTRPRARRKPSRAPVGNAAAEPRESGAADPVAGRDAGTRGTPGKVANASARKPAPAKSATPRVRPAPAKTPAGEDRPAKAPARAAAAGKRARTRAAAVAGGAAASNIAGTRMAAATPARPPAKGPASAAATRAKPAKAASAPKAGGSKATAARGRGTATASGRRGPAAAPPKPASSRTAGRTDGGQVVSMKEWVSRNTATGKADGSRGGRRR